MKRFIFFVGIFFVTLLYAQSLHVSDPLYTRSFDLNDIKKMEFRDVDTLSHASLSIYSSNGISQIKLSSVDSISLSGDRLMKVYHGESITAFRQIDIDQVSISPVTLPNRSVDAKTGSEFMNSILGTSFNEREPLILAEFLAGNIPDILRNFITLSSVFYDANNVAHTVEYDVMCDYLAIGTNNDYCRIPMGPATAQKIADAYKCILTTPKLCDDIWEHASVKLNPIPYAPVADNNSQVYKFIEHNTDINSARNAAGGNIYELIAGIKKDVVICNAIESKPDKVCIYGWHYTSGSPIQPLYTGHVDWYVDYSHGIRLLSEIVRIDGVSFSAHDLLKDPTLFKLLSNESAPMSMTRYRK